MSVFQKFKITKKGLEMLNRSISEKRTLNFSKFEIGSGYVSDDWENLLGVRAPFKTFPIISTYVQGDGTLRIKGYFDNKGLTEDKAFREIGIYARLDDTEEVLYSYTNAGDNATDIIAESKGIFSRTLDVCNYVANAEKVTINVNQNIFFNDFNTVAEMQNAFFLKNGDKIHLWGDKKLGDTVTKTLIVEKINKNGYRLKNGLFANVINNIDVKLDKGNVSEEYNSAKKIEDKLRYLSSQIERTPIGAILPYTGVSIPKDYLLCDGKEIVQSEYPELYGVLKVTKIKESDLKLMADHGIPVMKSNNQDGYMISVSSNYSNNFDGYKAFDNSDSTAWATQNGQKSGWIKIKYPNKRIISSFEIKPYSLSRKIRRVILSGISNGIEEVLFADDIVIDLDPSKYKTFEVPFKEKSYEEFKIEVTNDSMDPYCGIAELKILTADINSLVPQDDKGQPQIIGKKYLPIGKFGDGLAETGQNENGKYRIYASGYIEQWGKGYASNGEATVTLPISMNNNIYNVSANAESDGWPGSCDVHTLTKTNFKMYFRNYENSHNQYYTGLFFWKISGYLNSVSSDNKLIIKAKNTFAETKMPNYLESLIADINNNSKQILDLKNNLVDYLKDDTIPSIKLSTLKDEDKIKLYNLSDEVLNKLGNKLESGSVKREYIADGAVDISKLDNSIFHKEYFLNINKNGGQIQFKIDNINATTSDVFEIEWLAKEKTDYVFRSVHQSGVTEFNNKITITEITNGIYKYYFKANLKVNANSIREITYGDAGSGQVYKFNGEYYDFSIKINGKAIPFTFKNTSEEILLKRVSNNAVDFEETLKLINEKKVLLDDFNIDDKKAILGKADDEYTTVIEKLQGTSSRIDGVIGLPNIILKAGKYQITAYANRVNFKLYCFPSSRGGEILQVITLENLIKGVASEVIIEQDCYVGIQEFSENIGRSYWYGNGKTYKTNFYHTTQLFNKGQVLLVNQGDGAISSREEYTCPLQFKYTPVYALNAKSNTKNITTYVDNFSKRFGEIASFEISEIPSENKQTLYRIENIEDILYDDVFKYNNVETNIMTDNSILIHTPYQSVDEFTYRVKFKLNNLATKMGVTAYNGDFENGAWTLDTTNNTLTFGNAIPIKPIQTLELTDDDYEDRIGGGLFVTGDEPLVVQVADIKFEVGATYQIDLIRSGLQMTINIYDAKNDKTFTYQEYGSRFHGGKGVFVQTGEIEIKCIEEKTPLINGAKALFIGDSITEGLHMGTNDISKRWCSLLRDKYFKGNALCCGMGWGRTSNVIIVLNNIREYCNYIKYYFVMIGTNQSGADGFETWSKEIVEIYNKIKELGGIPVIICPPLNRNVSSIIPKMRDFILEKGWDTIRMDIATSTGDGVTFDNSLSTDGVHFNIKGNQKMYERALIDLKKIM